MKLTLKNYFTAKNDFLTSSKIKDYLLDPHYFFQKHILHTIEDETTDALILGAAVDCYLMYGKKKFNRKYKPVARRSGKEGLKYIEMTPAMYQKAVGIAERVMGTTAYRELDNFQRQTILTMKEGAGQGTKSLAGMLDFLRVFEDEKRAVIVDLKTTKSVASKSYYFSCLDYNYFLQAAVYVKLVRHNFGVEKVSFFHLAVEKDDKGIYPVKIFQFSNAIIDKWILRVDELIKEISSRSDWGQADVSFETPEMIGEQITEKEWIEV